MTPTIRITKVAYNKEVEIKYQQLGEDTWDDRQLKSKDQPSASFKSALRALETDVALICEVTLDEDHPIDIRSIAIGHHDEERISVKISAQRHLQDSPQTITLNTPLKWTTHPDDNQVMDEALWQRVQQLMAEAEQYLNGKRISADQGDLFEPSGDGASAVTEAETEPELAEA